MAGAFGRARADGAPAHEVGDVLRAEQVEELGACRQPELRDLQQHLAGAAQAFVDAKAAVQSRGIREIFVGLLVAPCPFFVHRMSFVMSSAAALRPARCPRPSSRAGTLRALPGAPDSPSPAA